MNALLKSLIIFLYPSQCRHCGENLDPSDGYYICKSCWEQVELIGKPYCEICGFPLGSTAALPEKVYSCTHCPEDVRFRKARSIADYSSAVSEAIRLLKYHDKTIMAKPLADLMIEALPLFFDTGDYDFIIPVPIHKKKRRERGYNQMELIGRLLSRRTGIPMENHSLIKSKNTQPQVGLALADRAKNVRGSFDVANPSLIKGKKILLIDDVMTTGATVNECARMLEKQGKADYVDAFTLTRVVNPMRAFDDLLI